VPARCLSLDDLAEELAVSRSQARALVRNGDIPAMRVGGRGQWRVERARLEAWITAAHDNVATRRTQHPPAEPTGGAAGVE
jgi:excisionase family DNA binding protein